MRVRFTKFSGNGKTGPIGVTMTEPSSCPNTCALKGTGCYARFSWTGKHWRELENGKAGIEWDDFIRELSKMPSGYTFRHNVAGDLPHDNGVIDAVKLLQLVLASNKKTGFTYTHHDMRNPDNLALVLGANKKGFTINISCDSLEQVDSLYSSGLPLVTILPEVSGKVTMTSAGHKVVTCPATYNDKVQCFNCGLGRPLCARADRTYAVGFPVHGGGKKQAEKVFMLRNEG